MNSPTYFLLWSSLVERFVSWIERHFFLVDFMSPSSVFNALDAKLSCLNVIVTKPPSEEHVGDFTLCVWQASIMRFT